MVYSNDTMPTGPIKKMLQVIVEHGYSIDKVVKDIGLDFNPLDPRYQHIQKAPSLAYSKLVKMLFEIVQDEAYGLNSSHRRPPGTMRLLCLFIIHCRDLRQALVRGAEFIDFCDSFIEKNPTKRRPYSEIDNDTVACRFYNPHRQPNPDEFTSDANVLYMMYRLYSWLIGRPIPLKRVCFIAAQGSPREEKKYSELFAAPIQFNAEENVLEFASQWLDQRLVQTEESLKDFLRQAPHQLISHSSAFDDDKLSQQVLQILANYSEHPLPSANLVADQLCMSPRTLHRQLRKGGHSYQQIKDEFRKNIALNYISRPDLSINTVAMLMGFQENSAFYRSFKKWTGLSPGQYRQQLEQGQSAKGEKAGD
jgi:AraC-like DNA-binding protein